MKKFSFLILILIITLLSCTVNAEEFFADGKNIYSDNVYMVNADTGKVVYELNSTELVYPASLTKIMTCILAIENCESLDEIVTIPSGIFGDIYADGGVNMNLKAGEEISVGDLIRATMIRSACDSASALAWHVSGSITDFAKLMNAKALEIGASNTHFVNAHGLHNTNHYTTAKDMYLIAEYALKNPTFCEIIDEYSCTIPETNKSDEREFTTTMDIENPDNASYYPYVTGVKSGFTDEAGRCLITKATKDGENYILVTLGANRDRYYESNMAFTDAVTLFEYYFAEYSIKTVIDDETAIGSAMIENGESESVGVKADKAIEALVALDEKPEITLSMKDSIEAPIKAGDILGTASIKVGDEVYQRNLLAINDVAKKSRTTVFTYFNGGNTVATCMDIVSIVLIIASVVILSSFLSKALKKKK